MTTVRKAGDRDVGAIRDLFLAAYEKRYTYRSFYDADLLKRMVYDPDTLLLVAEDDDTGNVLGTASVIFDKGEFGDLTGEFGRLVVGPDARKKGVGKALMQARIDAAAKHLHFVFIENRTTHPFSQMISHRFDFKPVGFLPQKFHIEDRESLSLYARHFGDAIKLRRNHPRVIPEAYLLAQHVLASMGIEPDAICDDTSHPYPNTEGLEFEDMTTEGYASLLRFERARAGSKEILGPAKVHQGPLRMEATHSHYVLARERGQLVGAAGFAVDEHCRAATIFEIVTVDERPVKTLVQEVVKKCREEFGMEYVEADVSAYGPRMQRTLLESGFVPVGYLPAFAFQGASRCDAVRMVRLFSPFDPEVPVIYEASRPVFEIVMKNLTTREINPRLNEALPLAALFNGLNDRQVQKLAEICNVREFNESETVITPGQPRENAYIILDGELQILGISESQLHELGTVHTGESLGETALVNEKPHTVTAISNGRTEVAVIHKDDLEGLIRRRPDIGVVVYRNLARGLGRKLRSMNAKASLR